MRCTRRPLVARDDGETLTRATSIVHKGTRSRVQHLTEPARRPRAPVLHQQQFPLQRVVLALPARDFQVQKRTFVVDQFGNLRHRRFDQDLHYRGQLGLKGNARRHVGWCARTRGARNKSPRARCLLVLGFFLFKRKNALKKINKRRTETLHISVLPASWKLLFRVAEELYRKYTRTDARGFEPTSSFVQCLNKNKEKVTHFNDGGFFIIFF